MFKKLFLKEVKESKIEVKDTCNELVIDILEKVLDNNYSIKEICEVNNRKPAFIHKLSKDNIILLERLKEEFTKHN